MSLADAKEIFLAAIELKSRDDREAFLKEACGGDNILRQRVDALILAHESPESLLERGASKLDQDLSPKENVEFSEGETSNGAVTPGSPTQDTSQQDSSPPLSGTQVHYFGDYELLGEIARGGMGVVYKARQVSLNRTVAIKMIRTGQFASDEEVQRFRTEAEAAANLQHSNIVAIHEVGQHEGQHYFSMDYVTGKNLADLVCESPLAARKAAEYVKAIAVAIHFAHAQGVLHRDLKPSNILIDSSDAVRITDFGLAKRTEGGSELTGTGQVLGTPSYMPPEQAGARRGQVGPKSDIYSMGAILYELLTGRPPFQAETPIDTLMHVLNAQPAAPRLLNPSIPRDLETICLKSLEKQPGRRYESAQELAADLGRFLNQEPVRARRASRIRHATHWVERHPRMIAATVSVLILGLIALVYGLWEKTRYLSWVAEHADYVREAGSRTEWASLLSIIPGLLGASWVWLIGDYRRRIHGLTWKQALTPDTWRSARRRAGIPSPILVTYAVLCLMGTAFNVYYIMTLIDAYVWEDGPGRIGFFGLFGTIFGSPFLGILVLCVAWEYRGSFYGFPDESREDSGQRQLRANSRDVLKWIGVRSGVLIALYFLVAPDRRLAFFSALFSGGLLGFLGALLFVIFLRSNGIARRFLLAFVTGLGYLIVLRLLEGIFGPDLWSPLLMTAGAIGLLGTSHLGFLAGSKGVKGSER
jgi:serine/threonine protein kinase/F0F1-type ATP synthase assembly protein I